MSVTSPVVNDFINDPVYLVTDTFNFSVRKDSGGRVTGKSDLLLPVGPFKITMPLQFHDDVTDKTVCAGVMKLRKALWAYVVGHGPSRKVMLALFDAKDAGIKTEDIDAFTLVDPAKTLLKLHPDIKAVFAYDESKRYWYPSSFDDMVKFTTAARAGGVG